MQRTKTKLDWKVIAGIDIASVEVNLPNAKECACLQDTLKPITFCDPFVEFQDADKGFIKVFQIAQLTVRYLLHSQTMLTEVSDIKYVGIIDKNTILHLGLGKTTVQQ